MEDEQLMQYLPVLMLGVLAVVATGGMMVASMILGKRGQTSKIKDTAYECGMLPIGEGNSRLSVNVNAQSHFQKIQRLFCAASLAKV
jgi:NADH-quinone oxidoreductase subunit A